MIDNTVEFVSVCYISVNENGDIWLNRIADIEDQQLNIPKKSNRSTTLFENRDRFKLYWHDESFRDGTVGVWRWTASPDWNNPDKDHVRTFHVGDSSPVRVVIVQGVQSMQALIEALKTGSVQSMPYICDTLFCYESKWSQFNGILCQSDRFIVQNQNVTFNDNIYILPSYSVEASDIYNWDDKNLRFLRELSMGEPEKYIPIGDVNELIRSTIFERMTWRIYKESIGKTKAEWRDCKILFNKACEDSLYEEVAEKLGCPLENAHEAIAAFVRRAGDLIDEGDIDSDVLAQIAENHDGLRTRCEAVVEEKWKTVHSAEIAAAQAQFDRIKKDKEAAEEDLQSIRDEIAEAQIKMGQLLEEIEEYEKLGINTVQAVRDKIGAAQKDMAGFIAELSVYMPQQAAQDNGSCELKPTEHWTFVPGTVYVGEENMEECSSWKDTRMLLWDNLECAGVGKQWGGMLSAFLYSAYLKRMPILLAGPNAEAIANALSLTICGKTVDLLKCCGEHDSGVISEYEKSEMAAIENPFHPDWITYMPQTSNYGFQLWLHPFTEDLQIEPRGLYNYAYPVFTECFVDSMPSVKNMLAGRKKEQYTEFQPDAQYRAKVRQIKKLGMSRLVINRLKDVLADAKCIDTVSDASMEYLFGMLPLSVLSGKQEVLAELLDDEKNLAEEVRIEIQRYLEV